jgi:hypothetical protein
MRSLLLVESFDLRPSNQYMLVRVAFQTLIVTSSTLFYYYRPMAVGMHIFMWVLLALHINTIGIDSHLNPKLFQS